MTVPSEVPHSTASQGKELRTPTWESSFRGNLTVDEFRQQWTRALSEAKVLFKELETADATKPNEENLLRPLDRLISGVNCLTPFPFQRCHPDKAMRDEADASDKACTAFVTNAFRSRALLDKLEKVDASPLDVLGKRFLERSIMSMKRAGAGLDDKVRAELEVIQDRLTVLEQDFARNIDEGELSMRVTEAELAGLPADFFKTHPLQDDQKIVITSNHPDYDAVMSFCDHRETRRQMYRLWTTKASPVNEPVLTELIELRGKAARLRGYDSAAAYALEMQMVKTPELVLNLLSNFKEKYGPTAIKEKNSLSEELLKLKQMGQGEAMQTWDLSYAKTKVLSKLGGFDMKEIKAYFPSDRTVQGVVTLAQRLFNIKFRQVDVKTWHEAVTVHDIYDSKDTVIGRIYLDLYPRKDKYSHACAAGLQRGEKGVTVPEVVMVANVEGGEGALSSLGEARTLFHELGHCLHYIFSGHAAQWLKFSGFSVETDFVESISQAQEEWLNDPTILRSFAKNDVTGEIIPDKVCKAIKLNSTFGNALGWYRQANFAAGALAYFTEPLVEGKLTRSVGDIWMEQAAEWAMFPPTETDSTFPLSFGHLSSYGPSYYGYLHSMIISQDILSAFKAGEGLMDLAVAQRLKETIMAQGSQKDGADLIKDFLGRPLSYDAFGKWLESSADVATQ